MCLGDSKEPSQWDGSFEYPQHMFWLRTVHGSNVHGSNVLRLGLLHCLCYPEFSLGNKASNPNAAAIMLLWWYKLTRIFTLRLYQFLKKYPFILSPPLIFLKMFLVHMEFWYHRDVHDKVLEPFCFSFNWTIIIVLKLRLQDRLWIDLLTLYYTQFSQF